MRAGATQSGDLITLSTPGTTDGSDKNLLLASSNSAVVHVNASTGNDSTGDGSSANPYLTLGKADTEIAASGGSLTHTEWETADDITEEINNPLQTSIGVTAEYKYKESSLSLAATPSFGSDTINVVATDANGTWLAGGTNGKIAYSTDNGNTWTQSISTTFGSDGINGIAEDGNGTWVAVGDAGKIAYSTSGGVSWTAATTPSFASSIINDVASDGTNWVAVGDSGKIAYSTDADTWTQASSPGFSTDSVKGVDTDGTTWAACSGGSDIRTSTDRNTWSGATLTGFSGSEDFRDITTDQNDNWVVVYADGAAQEAGYSTDNAASWSVGGTLGAMSDVQGVFTDRDERWFAHGDTAQLVLSIDIGVNWNTISNPFGGGVGAVKGGATDFVGNLVFGADQGEIAFGAESVIVSADELCGVTINGSITWSGTNMKMRNITANALSGSLLTTTLDPDIDACRFTGSETLLTITSDDFDIVNSLFITASGQDALSMTSNPSGTADVQLNQNTIIGNIDVTNASASADGFQIRDNIIEGNLTFSNATDKPTMESGNIRGSSSNVFSSAQVQSTNPLFINSTDYQLQREVLGFNFDSPLVRASVFTLRPDGVPRDLGAWNIDDSQIQSIFQRAHYLAKPMAPDAIRFTLITRENLQLGITSEPTVYNDPNRHLERITLQYGSLRREDHDFLRYAYAQRDRSVFVAIDPQQFIDVPDLTVNGNQSAGTPTVDIVTASVIEGSIITIGTKKYYVVYPYPTPANATGIVLDRPLEDDVSDTDTIAVDYPSGNGTYQLFLSNGEDAYTRNSQNEFDYRSGVVVTLIRKDQQ